MARLPHIPRMMDGKMDGPVSVGMEFLGVIDSVYTGLVLMPFLVLNEMFSFHPTTFFILKTDFGRNACLPACSLYRKYKS